MATIKTVLKNKKKDGTYNVQFDIWQNRQHAYISTDYYVLPNQFKNGKIQKHDNASIYNARLREKLTEYEKKLDTLVIKSESMTALEIKNYLIEESITFRPKLLESITRKINALKEEYRIKTQSGMKASPRTVEPYSDLRRSLFRFLKPVKFKETGSLSDFDRVDVYLDTVDVHFLKRYEHFLTENGLSNGRWNVMKSLRAIFNNEINEGNISPEYYPFRKYNINKLKKQTEPRVIDTGTLRVIFSTPARNKDEELARKTFLLDFLLLGINPADLYNFEANEPSGRYNFDRSKTDVINSIKIEPEAMQLIQALKGENKPLFFQEKYNTPQNFSKYTNKFLKRYAETIGIPEFTLGYARYTWATIAYNELDIDESTIDVALGHKTSKTVAGAFYIKKARTKVDEANRKMIDYLFGGE